MTALKQVLSDFLAVLLRLSACRTTSSHIPETVEESFHQYTDPHLLDQQPRASDDTTTTTTSATTMALKPHIVKPSSYLQSIFDLTLAEYSKQTGIDLMTHPFVISIDDITPVDKVITVLRERRRPSSTPQTDDPMALLMGHLESIAHMVSLLSPSEALHDNIDPVCQSGLDPDSQTFYMRILTFTIAVFTHEGHPWWHWCSPYSV
jgi:hypothetical protein